MKKLFTLLFTVVSLASYSQVLLEEDFLMTGNVSGQNGWDTHSGGTTAPITTTTGLTYAGYPGSGVGNAALIPGLTGQDINKGFAEQSGDGTTIFMTALVRVTETSATTGAYFLHMGDRATSISFISFAPRVFAKTDGAGVVNFGLTVSSGDALGNYAPTAYAANFTYLLIVKYKINTSGNDTASLWIRASGAPTTEALLGTPDVIVSNELGQDIIDAVGIRQASPTATPDMIIDGLRIANSLAAVLPLNLGAFTASLTERNVQLAWTSLNEQNVKGFGVERSANGSDFSSIGNVNAANRAQASYNYTDNAPLTGVAYYRLRMIDLDGSSKYSAVVVVNNRRTVSAQVFPNPTSGSLNVSHPKATSGANISILSAEGKQVRSFKVASGSLQTNLSLSDLSRGNYMLVFENDGAKSISKFVKN